MNTIVIELAKEEEFDSIGTLIVSAYRDLLGSELEEPYEKELLDVKTRAQVSDVYVAEVEGHLAGSVTYVGDPASPLAEDFNDHEVGVRMLAVDPKWQGKGVGKALVRFVADRARRDGARSVFLYSLEEMKVAHHIYEDLGFKRVVDRDYLMDNGRYLLAFTLYL